MMLYDNPVSFDNMIYQMKLNAEFGNHFQLISINIQELNKI